MKPETKSNWQAFKEGFWPGVLGGGLAYLLFILVRWFIS